MDILKNSNIDFIGDIHGYASTLKELLSQLGYHLEDGVYKQENRIVIFLGDYIDRGPEIRESLYIVKSMCERGSALALMGNHEYNILCYTTPNGKGGYLRKHSEKNMSQHRDTFEQFKKHKEELKGYIKWFQTLPLFIETDRFRVVHAFWSDKHINYLRKYTSNGYMSVSQLHESTDKKSKLHNVVKELLNGIRIHLPNSKTVIMSDGKARNKIRVKWWDIDSKPTYTSICSERIVGLPEDKVADEILPTPYKASAKPVFFGHYWLKGKPKILKSNICCLDYSIAKDGCLAAYSFVGEKKLKNKNIYSQS
jgi:hypothetical protein